MNQYRSGLEYTVVVVLLPFFFKDLQQLPWTILSPQKKLQNKASVRKPVKNDLQETHQHIIAPHNPIHFSSKKLEE